ncbi:hypothetical protein [Aestuariirhabdus litorea]|uniref:Uncharacterized protein n=1 Tax=Aestuariirhabdus litorea TaxID=2528527 RepID=A0A3P3VL77_9GAMM|nr:hypothetical protein [Aestuariirhabdus litorea]RRJ82476.1 hypothetical protein D0544_11415 [Aestuariirhabdus litorea]RWW92637.1 hypothetical protein DZC74_11390 [Endozoicomonadaceae bacterium GTF-13]
MASEREEQSPHSDGRRYRVSSGRGQARHRVRYIEGNSPRGCPFVEGVPAADGKRERSEKEE